MKFFKLRNWTTIKNQYHLLDSKCFQWMQMVDALNTPWKQFIREQNTNNLSLHDDYFIKKTVYSLVNLKVVSDIFCHKVALGVRLMILFT